MIRFVLLLTHTAVSKRIQRKKKPDEIRRAIFLLSMATVICSGKGAVDKLQKIRNCNVIYSYCIFLGRIIHYKYNKVNNNRQKSGKYDKIRNGTKT